MYSGLFHNVIAQSGNAPVTWALQKEPLMYALQLASAVNCTSEGSTVEDHHKMLACMRKVDAQTLVAQILPVSSQ